MSRWQRMQGDDGVALVMALVFIVIVGMFASMALDKNQSTSMVGQQVRVRTQLQYTLDGGVEKAFRGLQQELSDGSPQTCTDPADEPGTGALTLNGQTADYDCTTLAGRAITGADAALTTNYAIVVTGTAADSFVSSNAVNIPLLVSGSIYVSGPVSNTPSDTDLPKEIHVAPGDVVGNIDTSNCASWNDDVDFPLRLEPGTTGYQRSCTEQDTDEAYVAVAAPSPPPAASPVSAPGGCTVFFPGSYATAPALGNNSDNYFVSGSYRFESGVLSVPNNAKLIGGRAAAGDAGVPFAHQCSALTDASALLLPGAPAGLVPAVSGATLVLSGTSSFANSGRVALHTPPGIGAAPPANIIALGRSGDPVVVDITDPNSTTLLNAKLYAPDASIRFFANSATSTQARTGIIAKRLNIGAPAGSGLAIYAPGGGPGTPPPPFRTVRVKSRDAAGGSTATNTAVATISNYAPHTVDVLSWRSE